RVLDRLAAHGRAGEPRHPDPRGRPTGLHRRGHLGRHLACPRGDDRADRADGAPLPARDEAHGVLSGDLARIAEPVLRASWVEGERGGVRYAYTRPSPTRYPWQWYWDSCFAAIVWRRLDPARARAELESLLAAQRPSGFIGHTIFWHRPVTLERLPFYNVASRRSFQTETIQ